MKSIQVLSEAEKYSLYIADALYTLSNDFSIDKNDRNILQKHVNDLVAIASNIKQIKNDISYKKVQEQKLVDKTIDDEYVAKKLKNRK